MKMKPTTALSAASGLVWAGLAVVLFNTVDRSVNLYDAASTFIGGIVIAPVLGVIIGEWISPFFMRRRAGLRAFIAFTTLVLSALIFLWTARMADANLMAAVATTVATAAFAAWNGLVFGLFTTGFVVPLTALAYLNLWLVGRKRESPRSS